MKSSLDVANRFLTLAGERGDSLTPMQLLKLVYIAHGWMMGLYGRPLISEPVEAWQYGPVIRSLYNELRGYRGSAVTRRIAKGSEGELDNLEQDVVQQVYDIYGQKTGLALSRITHAPDTPWSQTYREGVFGTVIPTDLIEDHYRQLADKQVDPIAA